MYKTDSNNEVHVCIGSMVEIAEIKRTIAHMEADIAFHQNQMRLFEKLLIEQQGHLEHLEYNNLDSNGEDQVNDV
tara:strand:+ start:594 stop:818 length:225 start_codon:yes stop_codon:yes gene_type:complete